MEARLYLGPARKLRVQSGWLPSPEGGVNGARSESPRRMKEHRESYQDEVCVELKLSVPWQEGCPRNQQPQDMPSEVVSALTQPKEEDTGLEGKWG